MNKELYVIIAALITLIINGGVQWIREWQKHRTWRANGNTTDQVRKDVQEIKGDVKELKDNVSAAQAQLSGITVEVKAMNERCTQTVARFDKAISGQGQQILDLAKGRRWK